MKKLLKWTLLVTAVAVVVVAVFIMVVDLGFLRGTIERQASKALGRSLAIEDGLSIQFGAISTLEARGLRVTHPEWAGDGDLLEIDLLRLELKTASLWQDGPLTINRLDMDGLHLHLIEDENGRTNWDFPSTGPDEPTTTTGLPFLLREASVRQVHVNLETPRLVEPLTLRVDRLDQRMSGLDVLVEVTGEVKDTPMHFRGSIGPWAQLLETGVVAIGGTGGLGLATFTIEAELDDLDNPRRPHVRFTADAPSLRQLTHTLNLGDLGEGTVSLIASTQPADDHIQVSVEADMPALEIDLAGRMKTLQDFDSLSLIGRASGQNLGQLARLAGHAGWPEKPFSIEIDTRRNEDGLIIDALDFSVAETRLVAEGQIPKFPSIVGADLVLDFEGEDLAMLSDAFDVGPLPTGPFGIEGRVRAATDERTELDLSFETAPFSGRLQGFLIDEQNFELALTASGENLAALQRLQGLERLPPGKFSVEGSATGEPTGTRFEFSFWTSPGQGTVGGFLHSDNRIDLQLDMSGATASRLAQITGIDGLPDEPWNLKLGIEQASDSAFNLRQLVFTTHGISLETTGTLDVQALDQGVDLNLSLAGDNLSDWQRLAPDGVTLPAARFSLDGRLASSEDAWRLSNVSAEIGPSRIRMDGLLGRRDRLVGTDLRLALNGSEMGVLIDPAGATRLPEGPYKSNARLKIAANEILVEDFQLEAGSLSLQADVRAPWPLGFGRGEFRLQGQGQDITRLLPELAGLELEALSFSVDGSGRWSPEQVEISALRAALGDSRLQLSGKLDLPPDASATDMNLSISIPDLSRIATLRGTRYGKLSLELDTHLSGDMSQMEISHLNAKLGDRDIEGSFRLDLQGETPFFDLKLSTDMLNLRPFLEDKSGGPEPADKNAGDGRLIPETAIPFEKLAIVDGNFVIAADELALRRSTLYGSVISGRLDNGKLHINEMGMDMTGGRLSIGLDVVPVEGRGAKVSTNVHSRNLIFDFTDIPREQKLLQPAFDIDMDLEAIGSSPRELAASLNGKFVMSSGGGTILNAHGLDQQNILVEIVNAMAPASALDAKVDLSCFALVGDADDGTIRLKPGMALQTKRISTLAAGTVDLNSERLDLHINSKTRRMVDISAGELVSPFVKVTGTLADPAIGLDAKGTLLTGGAAILSGGLTLLAQKAIGQFTGENPCAEFLEEAKRNQAKP